jgi:very-short-patch-repair endonuclease
MRTHGHKSHHCIECNTTLELRVYEHSIVKFAIPLCPTCQHAFKARFKSPSKEIRELCQALRKRGVPAQMGKNSEVMTIDIPTSDAIVNIEIDGHSQKHSTKQALTDLKRSYHAFKRGYLTLRIPLSVLKSNLEETAQYITDFLKDNKNQIDFGF